MVTVARFRTRMYFRTWKVLKPGVGHNATLKTSSNQRMNFSDMYWCGRTAQRLVIHEHLLGVAIWYIDMSRRDREIDR